MRRPLVLCLLVSLLAVPARAGAPRKASAAYKNQVQATVDKYLDEMVPCMDASKSKVGTKVKLQVQVMILSDGTVLSVKRGPKGKKGESTVEECMLAKVKKWHFPPPPDRTTVTMEFPIELETVK